MKLPGTRNALLGGLAMAALMAAPFTVMAQSASAQNGPQSDFPMVVGQPYQVDGVTFVPSDSMNFDSVGYASVGSEGGATISAAHHTLPVPSYAEVTDIATGRTILVRIDRRGPMDGSHAIELSPGASRQLGITASGKAAVRVRRVNPPEAERALLRSGEPAPERMATPKPLLDVLTRKLNPALAQRTLDSADDDAPPARMQTASKPVITPLAPTPVAFVPKAAPVESKAKAPAIQPVASNGPPKGYVPSVPPPAAKPSAEKGKPKPGVKAPAQSPKEETSPAPKAAKPEVAKKPEVPAKPMPKPAPPAEAAHPQADKSAGSFTVQAGAFSDKARAQAVADKIGGTLSQVGKVWRVRAGPYAGHASAEAALAKVKSAGYSDARIQRAD